MYIDFYGLSQKPFDVTCNPRFLYLTLEHKETLASLLYGIQERRGIMALIGEVGTGKTTMLRAAIENLGPSVKIAFVFNTTDDFENLLEMVLDDLGILDDPSTLSKSGKLIKLRKYAEFEAKRGCSVVIIIDEAQNSSFECLENWRLLSNLETEHGKLIQIVLSGQPELERKLKDYRLRQLDQRIGVKRYIGPLDKKDTFNYVKYRLKVVGGKNVFDENSLELIWRFSAGIPRKINIVCDNALLIGYAVQSKRITKEIVGEAIDDVSKSPYATVSEENREFDWMGFRMDSAEEEDEDEDYPTGRIREPGRRYPIVFAVILIACIIGVFGFFLMEPMF
jgi:general secretion pathway protein A